MTFRKNISVDSLLKIIKTSKDKRMVRRARRRLSFKLDKEPRATLVKRLEKASAPLLKKIIRQRLWELDLDKSYDSLANVIKTSKKIDEVGYAVDIIGENRRKNGFPLLIKLLKHKHWYIRNRAALSLREFKNQRALNPLVKAIKKTDMNTSVSNLVYSLEVLDCTSILEFLTNLYISRLSNDWLTRMDILEVIKKTDLRKIQDSIIKRCVLKTHNAMRAVSDIKKWERLNDLCDTIENHRHHKRKMDPTWEKLRCDAEREVVKRSLKKDAKNPYLLRQLANTYYKQGRFIEAERPMAKAYRLVRSNALNIYNYALVLANLNRNREAIKLFKTVLRMSPKSIFSNLDTDDKQTIVDELKAGSRYNLAQCYLDLGDKSKAKHWLKSYIKNHEKGKPGKFKIVQAKRKLASIG